MFQRMQFHVIRVLANPVAARRGIALLGLALWLCVAPPPASAGLGDAVSGMAKTIINAIIIVATVLMAIGIATNFLTGMMETMTGRPGGLSSTWMRIAGIVTCFVGAVAAIAISNAIIDAITSAGFVTNDDLKIPTPP